VHHSTLDPEARKKKRRDSDKVSGYGLEGLSVMQVDVR
jgi:hypothetical protein